MYRLFRKVKPVFLDVHKVPFKEENLRELVDAPMDEYGVSM